MDTTDLTIPMTRTAADLEAFLFTVIDDSGTYSLPVDVLLAAAAGHLLRASLQVRQSPWTAESIGQADERLASAASALVEAEDLIVALHDTGQPLSHNDGRRQALVVSSTVKVESLRDDLTQILEVLR